MFKPNTATQFYIKLFGKKNSDFDSSMTLWQNIYVWKHEAKLNR